MPQFSVYFSSSLPTCQKHQRVSSVSCWKALKCLYNSAHSIGEKWEDLETSMQRISNLRFSVLALKGRLTKSVMWVFAGGHLIRRRKERRPVTESCNNSLSHCSWFSWARQLSWHQLKEQHNQEQSRKFLGSTACSFLTQIIEAIEERCAAEVHTNKKGRFCYRCEGWGQACSWEHEIVEFSIFYGVNSVANEIAAMDYGRS